jgi:hypothetical protein
MAPEIAKGRTPTPASDLYSLGIILFEMLSGQPPFDASQAIVLLGEHIKTPPPPLSSPFGILPAELSQLVLRLLEKDPASRPTSIDEVHRILRQLGDEEGLPASLVLGEAARGGPQSHILPPSATAQELELLDNADTNRFDAISELPISERPTDVGGSSPKPPPLPGASSPAAGTGSRAGSSTEAPATISFDAPLQQRGGATTFAVVRRRWMPGLFVVSGLLVVAIGLFLVGRVVISDSARAGADDEGTPLLDEGQITSLISTAESASSPSADAASGRQAETISTNIDSVPPGATVTIGAEHLCRTPCRTNLSNSEEVQLRFQLRGFRSETVEHRAAAGRDVTVTLVPLAVSPR